MAGEFFLVAFILICIMGGIWVFSVLPRQRDFIKRQQLARTLSEGDEVITGGGLVGRVMRIDAEEGVAYVEIAKDLQVRILTAAILDRFDPEEIAKNVHLAQEETTTS